MVPNCGLRPTTAIFSLGCSSGLRITQPSNGSPAAPATGASGYRIGRRRATRKRRGPLAASLFSSDFGAGSGDDPSTTSLPRGHARYIYRLSHGCASQGRCVRWADGPFFVVEGLFPERLETRAFSLVKEVSRLPLVEPFAEVLFFWRIQAASRKSSSRRWPQ